MELSSALTLEMLGKPFLLEKRIVLLHAIQEHGSISKAAKAVPMSYKSAWEAVDVMNSLAPEPIVCRETGGKDGGGTTITAYGETLLTHYGLLKAEHTRFLTRLSELTDIQSGTFKTIGRLAMQLSARNQIQVEVRSIVSEQVNAKVTLVLKSGQLLDAVITQEAVENLNLHSGDSVLAICKSSAIRLTEMKEAITKTNVLKAKVVRCEMDAQNLKVVVDVGGHDNIVSVMPYTKVRKKFCEVGHTVYLHVHPHDVMLGK